MTLPMGATPMLGTILNAGTDPKLVTWPRTMSVKQMHRCIWPDSICPSNELENVTVCKTDAARSVTGGGLSFMPP